VDGHRGLEGGVCEDPDAYVQIVAAGPGGEVRETL
jgi:acylphosphatase